MSTVNEVTDLTFKSEVLESKKPVIVDFWAPWCMPCRMMGPILDDVAKNNNGKMKFLKLNTDNNQSISAEYGIMSIPSLLIFNDGKEVNRLIGVQNPDSLQAELDKVTEIR